MATNTPKLALRKAGDSDLVNVTTDLDNNWDILDDTLIRGKHLESIGAAPTLVVGSGAGTGGAPSASINGTDSRGVITVLTGTGTGAGLALVVVTFALAYTSAPAVVITPINAATASALLYLAAAPTNGGFTVQGNAIPAASNTLKFSYIVIG